MTFTRWKLMLKYIFLLYLIIHIYLSLNYLKQLLWVIFENLPALMILNCFIIKLSMN